MRSQIELGNLWLESNQQDRAISAYQRALQNSCQSSQTYHELGDAFYKVRQWNEAETAYKQAISLDDSFFWSHQSLGDVLVQQERWNEAELAYQQAIALDDSFFWSHQNLANAFSQQKRWKDAELAYRRSLELQPDLLESYEKLATAIAEQERWNEAIPIFIQGIVKRLQTSNEGDRKDCDRLIQCQTELEEGVATWETYQTLLNILKEKQKWDVAAIVFWQAIVEYSTRSWWEWHYERLWNLTEKQKKLNKFEVIFRKNIESDPNPLDNYLNLAEVLTRQGKLDEAIACHQQCSQQELLRRYPELPPETSFRPSYPDFTIIGCQKGGTTSLYYYLNEHPNLFLSLDKEIHFWSFNYKKGVQWYLAHFPAVPCDKPLVMGEASPTYLEFSTAPERMYREFPNMKLIVLLRNPVDRAISHYYHWVRLNKETRPLEVALTEQLDNALTVEKPAQIRNHYIARGLYLNFLKKWMQIYPIEQFLVLASEAFNADPNTIVQTTHQFLGVPQYPLKTYKKYNSSTYRSNHTEIRQKLAEFYRPHNQKLESFLGTTFNWS
ncbi:hypothetical protein AY599_10535 [Leptolyngbya valderiana BDU 20041]|nr:hypothetical protein AY599_10535 [Leptolyngbya valderiana BDU 20041]